MSTIFIGLLTLLLILVSGYLVLIILMQRASSNSGMGSALGGGAAESALGAGAGNVLTKGTIIGSAAFFILSFGLYLMLLSQADTNKPVNTLPTELVAPTDEATAPDTSTPLVELPEGMDFTAVSKELQKQGATSTQVTTGKGTMIVTEDSVEVKPATDDAAAAITTESTESVPAETTAPTEEAPATDTTTETKPE